MRNLMQLRIRRDFMNTNTAASHGRIRHLVMLSLMTAIALTLFLVEAQIPLPIGIAGIKLGLANLVTLFLLIRYSAKDAAAVLLMRIVLGNLFTGQMVSFLYSLAGGMLSLTAMLLLCRLLKGKSIWFVSVMGGICHNLGQMLVAMYFLGMGGVLYYLPFLLVSGILMGFLVGVATQGFLTAWKKLHKHE
ncbi:MAG: Gx transporter family protein [Ruminococcus sp.]|nr:Gx transporter family protein [Ruminococcus sp.]